MRQYDVIIIGSGLGGLASGVMLSKEGKSVCVLEQHSIVGGCLQSFKRYGRTLDTGMHYVGSLAEGQITRQYFRYLGLEDKVRMRKLDEEAFDVICFNDGSEYVHAMGYERFADSLKESFPEEREGIDRYCSVLKNVGEQISPEIMREGKISKGDMSTMAMPIFDEIASCVKDPMLRNVLAGSNGLYGCDRNMTSIYEHAMISHSNIEGCYRFVGGTQHIADILADQIRANGGEVRTSAAVTKIHVNGDMADYVEVNGEERISAHNIISAIHPSRTLALLDNNTIIKKAFFTRVNSLENSFGLFTTYMIMKPGTMKYVNRNFYLHNTYDVWLKHAEYMGCDLPGVFVSMQPDEAGEYCEVVTLLTPVFWPAIQKWENTTIGRRGNEYEEFKHKMSEAMIEFTCQKFPYMRDCLEHVVTSSPLTYRDYTSTPYGSAYGIIKDYHNPVVSHLSPRTKIKNLILTGQNLNVHGCLGVCVSAAVSVGEICGIDYLARKIGNA